MAEVLEMNAQVVLDGTLQTIYSVPATGVSNYIPKAIIITNYGSSNVETFDLYLVANGDSAANKNILFKQREVLPRDFIAIDPGVFLTAGFKIMIQASTASVMNVQLNGVTLTVES